ncbi:carbohydrate ABC transporter permease [Paenibacillus qinlingensis]|uniref:ABC-type glycerol-3-phosphate transport system permease component n=1 Tax=Paenibacillus qinlingensis TaxID=1837343 RepID=A0ABU1NNH0_9BACL|nr:carbohydrate ABC transporter permease [Paenibacillus qinlingensis]MDR6549010.1 ABC-type glycerol-3-phosphate transport system permease component [Paenibacillus qinlingensis]
MKDTIGIQLTAPQSTSTYVKQASVYLILLAFTFISIMPIVWILLAALKPVSELNANLFAFPKYLTFNNFSEAWTVGKMGKYLMNSVFVAIPRVFFIILLASLAGFGFGKLKFPGRDVLFFIFLFGMMVPIQAMVIPLYYTMQSLNLINTYWALILPSLGLAMPFAIFMMRTFFKDLPDELMDVSKIDGCNDFKAFVHIMLPLTIPAITSLLVFEFMWSWNDFLLPLLFVYDDAYRTLPLGMMYFFGEYTSNQSLIAAGVSIAIVPIIMIYIIFQRKFIEGITSGSMKG